MIRAATLIPLAGSIAHAIRMDASMRNSVVGERQTMQARGMVDGDVA
jgi:hypothetical protein